MSLRNVKRCDVPVKDMRNKTIGYMSIPVIGLLILLLLFFIPGLTGLSLFGNPNKGTAKTEGYITLPPSYVTISDTMANVTWDNNDTNVNITYIDGNLTSFTVHDQSFIEMGWSIHYICDSIYDIKNATLSFTMECNQTINVSLFTIAQGPKLDINFMNQTIEPGLHSYNFTLIGTDGIFANVTESLDYLLFCVRNSMFQIRMVMPQDWKHEDIWISFDQIAMRFYATNLTTALYSQFFN